jgi:hypothetical protein
MTIRLRRSPAILSEAALSVQFITATTYGHIFLTAMPLPRVASAACLLASAARPAHNDGNGFCTPSAGQDRRKAPQQREMKHYV